MKAFSRPFVSLLLGALAAGILMLAGCGGGGGGGVVTPPAPTVQLLNQGVPASGKITTAYGTNITFSARVQNSSDQQVTFTLFGTGNAKLASNGDQAVFSAGTTTADYTVKVTAAVNGATQTTTIDVVPITITISPQQATVNPGGQVQFTAIVQGSTNTAATFTASAGTITPVSGSSDAATYTAPSSAGQYSVTAKASANSAYVAVATVTVGQQVLPPAAVNGTVTDSTGADLSGIVVQFFDSSGSQVASATTAKNGTFSASVPVDAVSFSLSPASIPTATEYEAYGYQQRIYDPAISGCNAPLPALTSGGAFTLTSIVVASNGGPPPPPPDGCS